MKVRIDIPMELSLHNQGVFRINKQFTSSEGETTWQAVASTDAIAGGTYLVDLQPGQYEKVLEATDGQFITSSMFMITRDGKYINQGGKTFTIIRDGTLLEENDRQEGTSSEHRLQIAVMRLVERIKTLFVGNTPTMR